MPIEMLFADERPQQVQEVARPSAADSRQPEDRHGDREYPHPIEIVDHPADEQADYRIEQRKAVEEVPALKLASFDSVSKARQGPVARRTTMRRPIFMLSTRARRSSPMNGKCRRIGREWCGRLLPHGDDLLGGVSPGDRSPAGPAPRGDQKLILASTP